ncbi:hypothetical protein GQ55_9G182200 [Panicum hallii var. hallii]|uniref:Uncharacterized protein n=1 Tax=Panicum hallii var. hallii TaxID=1504633 RepID=A0A2T7C4K8_9POAL|nr:hypothetical protein GQ55_9G182200 [Panicum hallii var. hallii]
MSRDDSAVQPPPVPLARGARASGAKATGEPGRARVASPGRRRGRDARLGSSHVSGPASPAPRRPSPPPLAGRRARVTTHHTSPATRGRHTTARPCGVRPAGEAKMRARFSGVRLARASRSRSCVLPSGQPARPHARS